MAKRLSEIYAPKSKDEKDFVAKQTVKKTTDKSPATKDDARFKATNVKTFDRSKHRFGYDAGDDQKAYGNGKAPSPTDMKTSVAIAPYTVKTEEEEIEEGNYINKQKKKEVEVKLGKDKSNRPNVTAAKRAGRAELRKEEDEVTLTDDDIDDLLEMLGEIILNEVIVKLPVVPPVVPNTRQSPHLNDPTGYNKDAVDKAIKNNRTGKIGKGEAKRIHGLLKGWRGK